MLAHALDLLLGGKPRAGIVRPGAPEAYVEGVFDLPAGLLDAPELEDLRERLDEHDGEVVLARRVSAEGRSRAYVQGRSATAADLRELGGRLLAFFGQHEHRRLTVASAQLELLDAFCGAEHLELRDRVAGAHARVRETARELDELRERAGTRDRDLDLLAFEIDEIEALDPSQEDEDALTADRGRLREVDGLRAAAAAGSEAVAPDDPDAAGAATLLAEAERLAEGVGGRRPGHGRAGRAAAGAADRGRGPGRRAARLPGGPGRRPRAAAPDRGAAGRLRPAQAQARRLGGRGARARRALPRRARPARRRRGGHRAGDRRRGGGRGRARRAGRAS